MALGGGRGEFGSCAPLQGKFPLCTWSESFLPLPTASGLGGAENKTFQSTLAFPATPISTFLFLPPLHVLFSALQSLPYRNKTTTSKCPVMPCGHCERGDQSKQANCLGRGRRRKSQSRAARRCSRRSASGEGRGAKRDEQ